MRGILNPRPRAERRADGLFADEEYRDVHEYFAAHPELPPTPLRPLPSFAHALGIGSIAVKDESARFGTNAFKIVGVRYAVHRLGDEAARRGLVCATAGNHGRAVAHVAREKHVPCTVFLPQFRERAGDAGAIERRTRASRVAAMRADGATVIEATGSYEDAVRGAAEFAATTGATVISDTSWPGYEQIPRWIMAGYTQIFEEAYGQWDRVPDIVLVQGGVGGLVCAAASWLSWRFGADRPFFIACEPDAAACLLESAAAGHPVTVAGELDTMMAGLRCAQPSPLAWPAIADGVDAFVSIPDESALDGMGALKHPAGHDPHVESGLSGACGLGALIAVVHAPELAVVRVGARVDRSTRALVVVTEGP